MKISGQCSCGSLSYMADAEPQLVCVCHCRDCQRAFGTAFGTLVRLQRQAVQIRGSHQTYVQAGGSGADVTRLFCPNCASIIALQVAKASDVILLAAGTLNDTSWVRPTRNIFCESAQSWVPLTSDTENFPRAPS